MSVLKNFLLIIFLSGLMVACQQNTPVPSPEPSLEVPATLNLPTNPSTPTSPSAYPAPFHIDATPVGTEAYPAPSGGEDTTVLPNPYPLPGQPAAIPPSGYEPSTGDQSLQRGEVYLEMADSKILSMESYPLQVSLVLKGNLPTPCHVLRVVVTPVDAEKRIQVEVYSVVDPNQMCTQVLEPFEATIPLGSYASGKYSVYVNGTLLGEFGA